MVQNFLKILKTSPMLVSFVLLWWMVGCPTSPHPASGGGTILSTWVFPNFGCLGVVIHPPPLPLVDKHIPGPDLGAGSPAEVETATHRTRSSGRPSDDEQHKNILKARRQTKNAKWHPPDECNASLLGEWVVVCFSALPNCKGLHNPTGPTTTVHSLPHSHTPNVPQPTVVLLHHHNGRLPM